MKLISDEIRESAKKIRMIILDVDGVLTDGSIILDNNGNEYKRFNVRDGHGVRMLIRAGIKAAIITGRRSEVVDRRAEELGITEVHQGVFNKVSVYEKILSKYNLKDEEVAFMGDDIVDIGILRRVGLSAVPADADEGEMRWASFVSAKMGGRGAVRELTNLILDSSGLFDPSSGELLD
jgi:3-deoxy-D-manno-octulosonate 8-phosphate phosphatase (KDO 8-P phosphatase)